jgi:hypothetical protein
MKCKFSKRATGAKNGSTFVLFLSLLHDARLVGGEQLGVLVKSSSDMGNGILNAAIAPLGRGTANSRTEPITDGAFVGAGVAGGIGIEADLSPLAGGVGLTSSQRRTVVVAFAINCSSSKKE